MKVVIDTNTIVSGTIKRTGNPAEIMNLFYNGEIQLYYSKDTFAEYERVLGYEKFHIPQDEQDNILQIIAEVGILIDPPISDIHFTDETDRPFYDTAKESGAILITGNDRHYPKEPFIIKPADFVKRIENQKK